jgi:ribonuclease inhibitor
MPRSQFIEIDLRNISTDAELQSLLMNSLNFPCWYGCNWNAFWDAITGLVEMPVILRFSGWHDFSENFPQSAGLMTACLNEMEEKYPELASKVEYV